MDAAQAAAPSEQMWITLNNGTKMPKFGLGLLRMDNQELVKDAVTKYGYCMYDSASYYKNEDMVGKALNELINVDKSHKREEIYVLSKAWWDEVDDVEAACRRSLKDLQVDYLDLYLVHWPVAVKPVPPKEEGGETTYERINIPMYKIWEQMESLVEKGLVKSIGVSNFNVQMVWDMLSYAKIKPVVNEVELHPLNVQDKLVKFLLAEKIVPIGYCPIARGADTAKCPDICETEIVKELSAKYSKTGPQILINWGLMRGHVIIPKSSNPGRVQENIEAMNFALTPEEIQKISALDEGHRICDNYPWLFGNSIFA